MPALTVFDWAICLGYLAVVFALGLWFANEQESNDDYFLGGRRMHWLPIGLSLFAGTFSSLSFVGLPSEAAYRDYHLYLAILFIPFVVTPVVWWLFLPIYFRLRVTSAYEYVELRFDRRLRLACSILFMLYTIGWMGNLLRAVGVILEAVFDLSQTETVGLLIAIGLFATFYTALGGVKAVVYTDALQALGMGGGMLAILLLAVNRVDGGFAEVWSIGNQHGRFDMFDTKFDFEHGNIYAACAFGIFVYLAGHAVNFTAVQRYVSMPNRTAAGWSLIVNGLMLGTVCGGFFLTGSVLFAFYEQQRPGVSASTPAANSSSRSMVASESEVIVPTDETLYDQLRREKHEDHLLPRFVMNEISAPGLIGLLLAGLFAAAMSSVDSGINSMTASVVCDWQSDRQLPVAHSRALCVLFGIISMGTAVVFYYQGGNVFSLIMKIAGMFFGLQVGIFLVGMLIKRATTTTAMIGLGAGLLGLASTFVLPISHWWYGAVTCIPTFTVGAIASLLLPPRAPLSMPGAASTALDE